MAALVAPSVNVCRPLRSSWRRAIFSRFSVRNNIFSILPSGGFRILLKMLKLSRAGVGSNLWTNLLHASNPFSLGVLSTIECVLDPVSVLLNTLAQRCCESRGVHIRTIEHDRQCVRFPHLCPIQENVEPLVCGSGFHRVSKAPLSGARLVCKPFRTELMTTSDLDS